MRFRIQTLVVGVIFWGASQLAHATLLQMDWQSAGDGLVVLDTNTGLEWLNLSVTAGNSILATEADSSVYGPFRWATNSEVDGLLSTYLTYASVALHYGDNADFAATVDFVNLLGPSWDPTGPYAIAQGVTRDAVPGKTGNFVYGLGFAQFWDDSNPRYRYMTNSQNCCWAEYSFNSTVGSWLVRDSQFSAPEPGTLFLLSLSLFGLGYRRKR